MAEDFPNLVKDMYLQSQETEWIPSSINPTKSMPGYIIIKFLKTKDKKTLKSGREKWFVTYRTKLIWIMVTFSSETMEP